MNNLLTIEQARELSERNFNTSCPQCIKEDKEKRRDRLNLTLAYCSIPLGLSSLFADVNYSFILFIVIVIFIALIIVQAFTYEERERFLREGEKE